LLASRRGAGSRTVVTGEPVENQSARASIQRAIGVDLGQAIEQQEVARVMLAQLLAELKPQLLRRVEARLQMGADDERRRWLPLLVDELVSALQLGRSDPKPCRRRLAFGIDIEPHLAKLRALKESVYELIEERELLVPAREMRVLAEWFAALTELSLRERQRRFESLLDALPDHVVLHHPDGGLVYANRSAREEAGFMRARGDGAAATLTAQFFAQVEADLVRVRRGDETVTSEVRFPTADGWHWREHHVRPVLDDDGRMEAIAFASRDIHARKAAETRLKLLSKVSTLAEAMEYEGVLSAVARLSIPELADWCIVDVVEDGRLRRGKVAHRDPAKAALAEELLRFDPELHHSPNARQELLAGQARLIPETNEVEMRKHASPELVEIVRQLGARSVLIVPFSVLGTVVAVATFVMTPESARRYGPEDLALAEEMARRAGQMIENARLHQQLQTSENRFRVALAHSNIAVFEEDREGRYRWVYNPQFGLEDPIGMTMTEFMPPETTSQLAELKKRVLDTGERVRTSVDTVINGAPRHIQLSYEALRDASGATVGITGVGVDLTEAKKVQEELARALAFREKMMGVLGHDLRNPVSAVHGLAGLLQLQEGVPASVREGLQRIDQSAQRMNEMIETLLDFTLSRSRGSLPVSPDAVDLAELCTSVVNELRVTHPGRVIRMLAHGDVRGRWDPARMAQVVSNLVGNALTHGAADGEVELQLIGGDGQVRFEVTNRGPAIPTELVGQIFEPFRQGASSRGLGLGLYIAQQIVLAHGGSIDVRSADDVTTFTVRLGRAA
jgi:PAS domain S-box-containing protein